MKIFEELSQTVMSFSECQKLAISLFEDERGVNAFKRFRGEVVARLGFEDTGKKMLDIWLEDNHRLSFEEKKGKFSEAMKGKPRFERLYYVWEGQ